MKDYIRILTQEAVTAKKKKMKRQRIKIIILTIVFLTISLCLGYWIAIPFALLAIGMVYYLIPIHNVYICPEEIRSKLQERLHQLEDNEKIFGQNPEILLEEDEIRRSLHELSSKNPVVES